MIYVYRQKRDALSALALAGALDGTRIHAIPPTVARGDLVICWGASFPHPGDGIRVLNGGPLLSKLTSARRMRDAGVETIHVSETPLDGWLPRLSDHVNGNDLLTPPQNPDFWARREIFTVEYRVHSFAGRSIRAGAKRKVRADAHPWIRSTTAGWSDWYDGVTQPVRDIAHRAVEALGLTFGAVDVGKTTEGRLVAIEVNRAPGLDEPLVDAYVRAVNRFMEEQR